MLRNVLVRENRLGSAFGDDLFEDRFDPFESLAPVENPESRYWSREELQTLLADQTLKLRKLGFSQKRIDCLMAKAPDVIATALPIKFGPNDTPFIPVLKGDINFLATLVNCNEKKGVNGIWGIDQVADVDTKIPLDDYFIVNVDNGDNTIQVSPGRAGETIKKRGRLCLITLEIIAVAMHTNVLECRGLGAAASSYGVVDHVPVLYTLNSKPILEVRPRMDIPSDPWSTPSCACRI